MISYVVLIEYNFPLANFSHGETYSLEPRREAKLQYFCSDIFLEAYLASDKKFPFCLYGASMMHLLHSQNRGECKRLNFSNQWTRRESNAGILGASEVFYH